MRSEEWWKGPTIHIGPQYPFLYLLSRSSEDTHMEKEETVAYKSRIFASRIVKLCKYLIKEHKEYVLSKQLLRSGTSIGANMAEAECAISKKDFLAKVYIAYKECAETVFWLWLLLDNQYLTQSQYDSINKDCVELRKMLMSITKTTERNLKSYEVQEATIPYGTVALSDYEAEK